MTIGDLRKAILPFFDEDEVVCTVFELPNLADTAVTVIGGILPINLVVLRPKALSDRLEADADAEGKVDTSSCEHVWPAVCAKCGQELVR